MRELKISLLENVRVDKIRKATEQEKSQYLEKKKKQAQEKGRELNPNNKLGEYIVQATQTYVRKKDQRAVSSPLDIRTDLKLEVGKTYTITAPWLVEVQGVHLLRADTAKQDEIKKDEK